MFTTYYETLYLVEDVNRQSQLTIPITMTKVNCICILTLIKHQTIEYIELKLFILSKRIVY